MNNPFTGENPLHDQFNWTKRFLPHYDACDKYQSITFRLNDALPIQVQKKLRSIEDQVEKILRTDEEIDKGYGSCLFNNPQLAQIMSGVLKFFDKQRYELISWVVMPNHVHVLIKIYEKFPLNKIIHSWKSFSSLKIAEKCDELGITYEKPIWQREYWDRFIRRKSFLIFTKIR